MRVKDIMRTQVFSVSPHTSVPELAELMVREHLTAVPVLDGGVLVGIVSEIDLMHRHEIGTQRDPTSRPWWRRLLAGERCPAAYVESHASKVADIMCTDLVSVTEDTPIVDVVDLLDARNLRRVPVVRAGQLVGIIGRADLLRALVALAGDPTAQNPMDDELIHRALRCELDAQPWWSPSQCAFIVSDGVVHFHGLVESQDGVRAARVAAERMPGVRGIVDHRLDTSAWGWLAR